MYQCEKENTYINSRRTNFSNYNKNVITLRNKREEKNNKVQLNDSLLLAKQKANGRKK